jgi:translation initiation factor IF-2
VIIESSLSIHQGPVATAIVKTGTLAVRAELFVEDQPFKIRSLTDSQGKSVSSAGPSMPVAISGFKTVPPVGSSIQTKPLIATKPAVNATPNEPAQENSPPVKPADSAAEATLSKYQAELQALLEEKEITKPPHINLIIKADVAGTLEAIKASLPDEAVIISSGVGDINDSDVNLAASSAATIIAFNVKVSGAIVNLAQVERVKVKPYAIIYKLLEDIETIILKLLEPTIDEEALGVAQILQIFDMKGDRIAGCKVIDGEIKKTDLVHLIREAAIITEVKIVSLKTAKVDVDKVKVGSQCGIILKPQNTFQVGDTLQAYKVKSAL